MPRFSSGRTIEGNRLGVKGRRCTVVEWQPGTAREIRRVRLPETLVQGLEVIPAYSSFASSLALVIIALDFNHQNQFLNPLIFRASVV